MESEKEKETKKEPTNKEPTAKKQVVKLTQENNEEACITVAKGDYFTI